MTNAQLGETYDALIGCARDELRAGISFEPTYEPAQKNLARLGSYPHQGSIVLGDEKE